MTTCTAAWNQKAYRGRNDDGDQATATWKANQNVNWTQAVDENFRVRFEVQETAACAGNNKVWQLQYNLNAAGWVTVNGTSNVVRSTASPNVADAANLTDQLTAGTGTFQGATGFDEANGAAGGASMDLAASGHAEAEFCVQIRSADVVHNDSVQLRITDNGSAFAAYDATPTITVSESTPTTVSAPVVTHTYTAQVPKAQVKVMPGAVAHTYSGQVPTLTVAPTVRPDAVAHTYTGQVPQVKAMVQPGAATHTYTVQAPGVANTVNVLAPAVAHVYTTQAPQVQSKVQPGAATHSYAPMAPQVRALVSVPVAAHVYAGAAPTITDGGGGGPAVVHEWLIRARRRARR